jgi:hypothetical protein
MRESTGAATPGVWLSILDVDESLNGTSGGGRLAHRIESDVHPGDPGMLSRNKHMTTSPIRRILVG